MPLDKYDPETVQSSSTPVTRTSQEDRMTSNTTQSASIARAVGESSAQALERQSAEVLKVSTRSRPSAVAGAIAHRAPSMARRAEEQQGRAQALGQAQRVGAGLRKAGVYGAARSLQGQR